MRKNILFVIDSLECAGAEKSLVTLLSLLDYSKFKVDLMLFTHGKMLEEFVPQEVKILNPLEYTDFTLLNLKEAFLHSSRNLNFKMLSARLKYSIKIRMNKYNSAQEARIYWQNVSKVIRNNSKKYDIAISYGQGVPTFYVAEKVQSKKKFAWVNTSFRLNTKERDYQMFFYDKFNKIVTVSDSAQEIFLETFPNYIYKTEVIYDINNYEFIYNLSRSGKTFDDYFEGVRILTIGRLANEKGYDIALKACKKLKESGINFRWYVLGKGYLEDEILNYIKENGLADHFILLGVTPNPYPFIKNSDIYVQTSKFEGFGLAIAEARMLNIPVVTTRFDSVFNQITDGKNGLVVDMTGDAVCNGIIELINNVELRESIVNYLKNETKGNSEEINKFYQLIG